MGTRLFALVRAAIVSTLFVSLWIWFLPNWIANWRQVRLSLELSPAAIALMIIGGSIMLKCVWDFAWQGRGTPAPFDPPRRLVVSGLYRYVRNPMYVGMGTWLIGEALALPAIRNELLIFVAIAWAIVTAFILVYEEPTLRRLFGEEYVAYCAAVRRWIPRLRPFDKAGAAA